MAHQYRPFDLMVPRNYLASQELFDPDGDHDEDDLPAPKEPALNALAVAWVAAILSAGQPW